MKLTDFFALLGGLALFLYGMKIMGDGLELVAGTQLQKILEKLTTNRFLGMLVGVGVTAIIQSSSATTVMVVGFVNAGLMNLSQAIGVIMGANIGTTVTGQLIALDIGTIAPVIAFVGVLLIFFAKRQRLNHLGLVIIGLGMLFIGMTTMSGAMKPLRDVPEFRSLMTNFSNPFVGVLTGTLVTCIIQSSSASVGILQAMAAQGLIGIGGAMYVVFGQNIGTCITALLASIGSSKNARRAALCHVLFNVFGTVLFITVSFILPLDEWMIKLAPGDTVKQIANLHTSFNIATTILLLPFGSMLGKIALKLIKGEDKTDTQMKLEFIDNNKMIETSVAIVSLEAELSRMEALTRDNIALAMSDFNNPDKAIFDKVNYQEDVIDFLNKEIKKFIIKTNELNLSKDSSLAINKQLVITSNLERIGDHALNVAEHTNQCAEHNLTFSAKGLEELGMIRDAILEMFSIIENKSFTYAQRKEKVSLLETKVDRYTEQFRNNHIDRVTNGECNIESGILYDEILTDLERVADHLMNIAEA
ncbi:MAG: Na/Pi cotransporter family protein [Anaerocolumna sp.]|jgi:phosphate:Na+ symporter|nr:Na/Pi cotransporter family protein [Anaerocolumna sp.]